MSKLDRLLNANEQLLWRGKPIEKAFVLPALSSIPFGLIFLGFSTFWMWGAASAGAPDFFTLFGVPLVIVGFGITISPSLWQLLRYRNTEYVSARYRRDYFLGASFCLEFSIEACSNILDRRGIVRAHQYS